MSFMDAHLGEKGVTAVDVSSFSNARSAPADLGRGSTGPATGPGERPQRKVSLG